MFGTIHESVVLARGPYYPAIQTMTMIFVEEVVRKTAEILADSLCRKTQSCTIEMIGAA